MKLQEYDEAAIDEGLTTIEAEFFTEYFIVHGKMISPELRLSDHLNSATTTLELHPQRVHRLHGGVRIPVDETMAYISKAHILFVLPVHEPSFTTGRDQGGWQKTINQTCWAGVGRYNLVGKLHMEASRNPRLLLRSLQERQFLPMTDVELTLPDGSSRHFPTVVVNRAHVEILALRENSGS